MCTIRVPINVCAKYQKACYYKLGGLLRKKVTFFCLAIYRKYSQCKFNPFFLHSIHACITSKKHSWIAIHDANHHCKWENSIWSSASIMLKHLHCNYFSKQQQQQKNQVILKSKHAIEIWIASSAKQPSNNLANILVHHHYLLFVFCP